MATKSEILNDLSTLRDEARVQLHLLSMDARKHWDGLEKQLGVLEQKLTSEAESLSDSTVTAARTLQTSVKKFFQEHDVIL